MTYQKFRAEVVKELSLRRMSYADLAKKTGYKLSTINMFMSETSTRDRSDNVASAISAVLNIPL